MLRLTVHPDGLPRISSMTPARSTPRIHQLRRKSRDDGDETLGQLIDEIESCLPRTCLPADEESAEQLRELAVAPA